MIKQLLPAVVFFFFVNTGCAQQELPLYPASIPNAKATADSFKIKDGVASKVSRPTITPFLPAASTLR